MTTPRPTSVDAETYDIITQEPANPGAGSGYSLTGIINARQQLLAISLTLTTSAAVATRLLRIYVDRVGVAYQAVFGPTTQLASDSIRYHASLIDAPHLRPAGIAYAHMPLHDDTLLREIELIRIDVANMDAADQISGIILRSAVWTTT